MNRDMLLWTAIVAVLATAGGVFAQWIPDGVPICTAPEGQRDANVVSDKAGGAIFAWRDDREFANSDIYAARVNSMGVPLWAADGIQVCSAPGSQNYPRMIQDGAGGAFIAWEDGRPSGSYDIYVQHIDGNGTSLWAANGVAACAATNDQYLTGLVSDGAGGVIVLWDDYRTGTVNVFAQRIDVAGNAAWVANGIAPFFGVGLFNEARAIPDGNGGAIIAAVRTSGDKDVYAQRIGHTGLLHWGAGGVAITNEVNNQRTMTLTSDGAGGAIIAWDDDRSISGIFDIYAQRVDAAGLPMWSANGVAICSSPGSQYRPLTTTDQMGGAIIGWTDDRDGADVDVYAQRVTHDGELLWDFEGQPISKANDVQSLADISIDDAGGAILIWRDFRSGGVDQYAQRLTPAGVPLWATDGMPVTAAAGTQDLSDIAADGDGGIIAAWSDSRGGSSNIYAQRIEPRYGYWGHPEPRIASVDDVPQDQGGKVAIDWYASDHDFLHQQRISHYSIWRATNETAKVGAEEVELSDVGADYRGRAIRNEKDAAGNDFFWELVGTQEGVYLPAYSYVARTTHDSTSSGKATHHFQVISHGYGSQYLNWPSDPVDGYSVDNIPPLTRFSLVADDGGPDIQLRWGSEDERDGDLDHFAIYRGTSSGLSTTPENFIATTRDTSYVDQDAPAGALFYVIAPVDMNDNQGEGSNEVRIANGFAGGPVNGLKKLQLLGGTPNPFRGSTEIRFALPRSSEVNVEVFDVAGRRVWSRSLGTVGAGWQHVGFDGLDNRRRPLAGGLYFVRVSTGEDSETRKIVLQR